MRLLLMFALGAVICGAFSVPIITRHDVPDQAYLKFAEDIPVTSAVVKYSVTDVAGTLIAPRWLLSAAHVAETIDPGRKLLTSTGDSVEVARVFLHPGWIDHGRPEDIALIQLRGSVDSLPIVPIYRARDEIGREVVVVGNGDHGTGLLGPEDNDGRMRAATNLVDEATDDYLVWRFDDPRETPDRATRLEGVSGPGDSGGPAFVHVADTYYLAGVSSGQSTQATGGREGRYGVTEYYSRVSSYLDWIDSTVSY